MRRCPSYVRFRFIFVSILLTSILFLSARQAAATGGEYGYVRIYSAKVANGLSLSLGELEAIARELGTEEIAMFRLSEGPEEEEQTWLFRAGLEEYACPGITVHARGFLAGQQTGGGGAHGESEPCWTGPVNWTLPDADGSPLLIDVHDEGSLLFAMTVYEQEALQSEVPWPEILRLDVPGRSLSFVQVFEYLDGRPTELPPVEKPPVVLPRAVEPPDAVTPPVPRRAPSDYGRDQIQFDGVWGWPGGAYDSGWQPSGALLQIKLSYSVGCGMTSNIGGNFVLDRQTPSSGYLFPGSAQGNARFHFGLQLTVKAKVYACEGVIDHDFSIPGIPDIDFGIDETAYFNNYLLDSQATMQGTVTNQSLFTKGYSVNIDLLFVTVTVGGEAGVYADLALQATMSCNSITVDGKTFTSEGQSVPVTLTGGTYSADADYNESTNVSLVLTFYPSLTAGLDSDVCEFNYTLSPISFDWTVPLGSLNLDFDSEPLAFDQNTTWFGVPTLGVWGMIALVLVLVFTGGALIARRRRAEAAVR